MAVVKINSFLPMLGQSKSLVAAGTIRSLSTVPRLCASHYDVLGITPKATQGDIKSAYYKLSKIYHPDKSNNDEAAAKKFRAISEAYEVLGNIQLKKMYDKGLITGKENTSRMHQQYQPEPEPTDPTLKFYKSRVYRHITPTMDGRTPLYDYDAWSRNHYGDLFQRSQYDRELIKKRKQKQMDALKSNHQEHMIYLAVAVVLAFTFLVANGTTDYDRDVRPKNKVKEDQSSESL